MYLRILNEDNDIHWGNIALIGGGMAALGGLAAYLLNKRRSKAKKHPPLEMDQGLLQILANNIYKAAKKLLSNMDKNTSNKFSLNITGNAACFYVKHTDNPENPYSIQISISSYVPTYNGNKLEMSESILDLTEVLYELKSISNIFMPDFIKVIEYIQTKNPFLTWKEFYMETWLEEDEYDHNEFIDFSLEIG